MSPNNSEFANWKLVYFTNWTEYERGWGSRPDGVSYAIELADLKAEIARLQAYDTPDDFSRHDDIKRGFVTESLYEEIKNSDRHVVNTLRNHDSRFCGAFLPA